MKYPIGVQSFEDLRKSGYVYVDKTGQIYKLTNEFKYVFLGRPRRFGKSLLLSTIEAYFEGRRELFEGLAIDRIETEWTKHPVLHFDLNSGSYSTVEGLMSMLNDQLSIYEAVYGKNPDSSDPNLRLGWLIRKAHELTGQGVVILVDEYDKPVLHAIGDEKLDTAFRNVLKPFYGCLKSCDRYIRFAMLTGVSKFGKLSVFSDLNNIKDISLLDDYAAICGITKQEIIDVFKEPIAEFAEKLGVSDEEMIDMLRRKYDGYRFTVRDTKVFNPYSLLNAFADKQLRDYWFESGTPTFLVKLLESQDYDLSRIEGTEVEDNDLYKVDNISAIPILYQSGYLTIKGYDPESELYTLGYPNQEVENGFLKFLVPYYSKVRPYDTKSELFRLMKEIKAGDVEAFMDRLRSVFYSIPYAKDNSAKVQEDQFRNLTYLIFKLLGIQMHVECPMSRGRSDAIVWTDERIYVIELKVDSTPERAVDQIRERGYAEPLRGDGHPVILIGVNYSTTECCITGWLTEEL